MTLSLVVDNAKDERERIAKELRTQKDIELTVRQGRAFLRAIQDRRVWEAYKQRVRLGLPPFATPPIQLVTVSCRVCATDNTMREGMLGRHCKACGDPLR